MTQIRSWIHGGARVACALLLLFATSAAALDSDTDPGPEGWGEVPLGANEETLLHYFPEAEKIRDTGIDETGEVRIPRIIDYKVTGQRVLGLTPCNVTFRLAGNQIYNISFDCRAAAGDARAVLEQSFGQPGVSTAGVSYWLGQKYGVSQRDGLNVFGFFHRGLNELLQRQIQAEMIREQGIAARARAESGASASPGSPKSP